MDPGRAALVSLLLTLAASSQLGHSVDAIAHTGSASSVSSAAEPLASTITGAMVADGTGSALARLDVRFEGDSIREIGSSIARPDDRVIDGTGLVLAPGFIDAHNHSTDGLNSNPEADTQVSQGITTVLLGQDGSSPLPIRDYLARRRSQPAAVNVAVLVGHATVRRSVMGNDFRRESTTAEIAKMEALVNEAGVEGAIGLSSGLEYEVGSYASTAELVALARVAARHVGNGQIRAITCRTKRVRRPPSFITSHAVCSAGALKRGERAPPLRSSDRTLGSAALSRTRPTRL